MKKTITTIKPERYEAILDQLEKNGMYIAHLSPRERYEISNDKIAMQIAAYENPNAFVYASEALRSNKTYMLECLHMNIELFIFSSQKLLANEKYIEQAGKILDKQIKKEINEAYLKTTIPNAQRQYIKACVDYRNKFVDTMGKAHRQAKGLIEYKNNALDQIK